MKFDFQFGKNIVVFSNFFDVGDSKGAKVLESQVEKSMEKPLRNSRTKKYKRCLDHKPWITGAAPNAPRLNNNKEALLRSAGYEREAARLSGAWTRTEGPEVQLRQ